MAENKKHPEEETKIEQLNDNLTKAGVKVEENKKTLMIIVGAVIAVGLLVAAYFYFFHNPGIDKAFDAYGKVEIENGTASETAKAEAYKKVADQYEGSDAGKLAALEAAENGVCVELFDGVSGRIQRRLAPHILEHQPSRKARDLAALHRMAARDIVGGRQVSDGAAGEFQVQRHRRIDVAARRAHRKAVHLFDIAAEITQDVDRMGI